MRLVQFADLHLDTPFVWAGPELARARRQGLRDTLARIVGLAGEDVDALICSGDLFEHERFTVDTGEFLRAKFAELNPTPVLISPGNHDWLGPESLYSRVRWSPNVHIFSDDRLEPCELTDGFTVWGGAHRAPRNTGNFLDRFHVDRDGFNLAAFHGSERSGLRFQEDGKIPHAPFDAADIVAAGLDYALCGHYHVPRVAQHYLYPGNPDPLTFGETGARGAVIVEISDQGAVSADTVAVASTIMFDVAVDVSGCTSGYAVRERVKTMLEGRTGIARVTLEGELEPDVDVMLRDLPNCAPWMDAVVPRLGTIHIAIDFDALEHQPTVEGRFVADVRAAGLPDDEQRRVILTGLRALRGRDDLEVL